MRVVLLAAAVSLTALTLPATATAAAFDPAFSGGAPSSSHGDWGRDHRGRDGDWRDRDGDRGRHDRRRHGGFDGGAFIYDREYQGDTAWRSSSYNDWWHERTSRSYPRWVQNNQGCDPDRMWWGGGVWRCTW